jgi:hypothetical protein
MFCRAALSELSADVLKGCLVGIIILQVFCRAALSGLKFGTGFSGLSCLDYTSAHVLQGCPVWIVPFGRADMRGTTS